MLNRLWKFVWVVDEIELLTNVKPTMNVDWVVDEC